LEFFRLRIAIAHAQRNFRRTRPNQFHGAAEIVSPMRSEIFGGFDQINFNLQMKSFRTCAAKFSALDQINFNLQMKSFRPCVAKFSADSTKAILRCSSNCFTHAQRNFRRTRLNQFHGAAEIVSPMCSEIFGGLD